jgi:protease I
MADLSGRRIAVLATDGVEQIELTEPVQVLKQAGAEVVVVAPHGGEIQGMNHDEKGSKIAVDQTLDNAQPERFDALVLPGGLANPDKLRMIPEAVSFVRHFVQADKPIAAICHGPWMLIEAGGVKGKRMTSWPSLRTDLRNAGAEWEDNKVLVDGRLVTSRKPDDLPDFNREMLNLFEKTAQRQAV